MHSCDIIIPTHGQRPALSLALKALARQHIPAGWQPRLIISHDGDSTPVSMPPLSHPWAPPRTVRGPQAGAAAARNRALATIDDQTASDQLHVVLFLGDDIILRPGALAAHVNFHTRHPQSHLGALGFIAWDPRLSPTPLMEWMVHGGPQNNFDDLLPGQAADPAHFFYGSFVSVKRPLIGSHSFPLYPHYGWEDLDFGRQLSTQGLILHPLHRAQATHHHQYSSQTIVRRSRLIGRSLAHYQQRHPGQLEVLTTKRTWWRVWVYRYTGVGALARLLLHLTASRYSFPRLFLVVTASEHWSAYLTKKPWKSKKQEKT